MRELVAAALLFCAPPLFAQKLDSLEGLWQGFDGEWGHVSRQVIALAETIPAVAKRSVHAHRQGELFVAPDYRSKDAERFNAFRYRNRYDVQGGRRKLAEAII